MNIEAVAKLMELMQSSTLGVLEVEQDGLRVRMENALSPLMKTQHVAAPAAAPSPAPLTAAADPSVPAPPAVPVAAPVTEPTPGEAPSEEFISANKQIRSEMVGIYHDLKDKQVKVGDTFKKGESICIIEAMKIMNEITAEEDCEILWVAVGEGDVVEYGQLLFVYK